MENDVRRYKAFISYRHLPLDMEVAEKIHKIIEHYVIPRNLRKNGEKKLGYVFRDKEELPISGNLSANIQTALDNSEFLIVICTPETQKSEWVLQEIRYFIETHDRDHVLAVLADGLPEESFPKLLTEITAEDGSVFSKIEPLAANVASKSRSKRNRLLKTESLRLLAALVGFPYDALFKREQRYRHRKNMVIAGVAAAIAATFMGMLINRNREINRQLQQSLINESTALSAVSWNLYKDGQYTEAIEAAVKALPWQGNERPYVEDAAYTLSRELDIYGVENIHYLRSFSNDTNIWDLALSKDGSKTAVYTWEGTLKLVDSQTGITQWSRETGDLSCRGLYMTEYPGILLAFSIDSSRDNIRYYRCDNGELIWELTDSKYVCHNETLKICITSSRQDDGMCFEIRDLDSGMEKQTIRWKDTSEKKYSIIQCGAISDDGSYGAVALSGFDKAVLLIANLHTGEICLEKKITGERSYFYYGYRLAFTDRNHLALAFDSDTQDAEIHLYDSEKGWQRRFLTAFETGSNAYDAGHGTYWEGGIQLFTCSSGYLILADYRDVYYLDESTGEFAADIQLPAAISRAAPTGSGRVGVILQNGLITECYPTGKTGADMRSLFYECGYDVSVSAFNGESFRRGTFAVVPDGNQSNVAILREAENPRMEEVFSMDDFPVFSTCFVSPSGKLCAMVGVEDENAGKIMSGFLCHRETGEKTRFRLTGDFYLSDFMRKNCTALTDDGQLLSNGMVYDIKKDKFCWLSDTGEEPRGYDLYDQGTADGGAAVYTVLELETEEYSSRDRKFCIWKNGVKYAIIECPEGEEAYSYQCLQVMGDSILFQWKQYNRETRKDDYVYSIYSISTGKFTSLEIPEDVDLDSHDSPCYALAEKEALLAVVDGDSIRFYNTETGEMCDSIAHGWYEDRFCKLQFAMEDTLLFGFTKDNRFQVYDVRSGQLLAGVHLDSDTYGFSASEKYSFFEIQGHDRVLLVLQNAEQRLGIMLRRSDWSVVGLHDGIVDYRTETGELLVYPRLRGVYRCKLLNGEEIIAIGREYLETGRSAGGWEAEE